jgi:hypothetical protein
MYRGGSSAGGGGVNNLNGSGGRRQVLSSVDFYRRVPKDLTEVRDAGERICWMMARWVFLRLAAFTDAGSAFLVLLVLPLGDHVGCGDEYGGHVHYGRSLLQ